MENNLYKDIRFSINSGNGETHCLVVNDKVHMAFVQNDDVTRFVGIASTEYFSRPMVPAKDVDLLIKGFNNRTRERNYFKLYCQFLSNEISEEEFDKEIEDNENTYVVDAPGQMEPDDICKAILLSDKLMDIKTTDDFSSTFGIDDASIDNYVKLIGNE